MKNSPIISEDNMTADELHKLISKADFDDLTDEDRALLLPSTMVQSKMKLRNAYRKLKEEKLVIARRKIWAFIQTAIVGTVIGSASFTAPYALYEGGKSAISKLAGSDSPSDKQDQIKRYTDNPDKLEKIKRKAIMAFNKIYNGVTNAGSKSIKGIEGLMMKNKLIRELIYFLSILPGLIAAMYALRYSMPPTYKWREEALVSKYERNKFKEGNQDLINKHNEIHQRVDVFINHILNFYDTGDLTQLINLREEAIHLSNEILKLQIQIDEKETKHNKFKDNLAPLKRVVESDSHQVSRGFNMIKKLIDESSDQNNSASIIKNSPHQKANTQQNSKNTNQSKASNNLFENLNLEDL